MRERVVRVERPARIQCRLDPDGAVPALSTRIAVTLSASGACASGACALLGAIAANWPKSTVRSGTSIRFGKPRANCVQLRRRASARAIAGSRAPALSDAELVALLLAHRHGRQQRARRRARPDRALRRPRRRCLRRRPREVAAVRGVGPAKGAELAAVVELARRSLSEEAARARRARLAAGGPRLPAALARRAAVRGLRRAVPRQPEPAARRGGALPRHARADQRLPARGRQGGARAQRRRR